MRGEIRSSQAQHGHEQTVLERLLELADRIRDRLADRCETEGVNASRFAILKAIADGSDQGCSQTELAKELGLSESNVCSLVERMRAAGLLFRFRSKADRRKSVLLLSERGEELAQAICRVQRIEAEALISVLEPQQQAQLQSLLEQLHEQLEATRPLVVVTSDVSDGERWESSTITPAAAATGAERTSRRAS